MALGDIMERINLDYVNYLKYKKPHFEGSEGKLYIKDNNELYKFYRYPWKHSEQQIISLNERQTDIKYTTMPLGSLYLSDIFAGAILKYFKDYKVLEECNINTIELLVNILKIIKRNIQELTDNYIYLTDLNMENVLLSKDLKVELIDLDGNDTIVTDKESIENLNRVLKLYQHVVLKLLYPSYDPIDYSMNPEKHLEEVGLNKEFIGILSSHNVTYEILDEVINYTYKDKKYIKK